MYVYSLCTCNNRFDRVLQPSNDFLPSSQAFYIFLGFITAFEICRNILMLLIYFHLTAVIGILERVLQ